MFLIDSHIHLNHPDFQPDLERLLQEARKNNINGWIIPGTIADEFDEIATIATKQKNCFAAYGLHPYFSEKHNEQDIVTLRSYIKNHHPVAIGECGLDAIIPNTKLDQQLLFFKAQIKLAIEFDLPLIIHSRKTNDLILKEIRKHPTLKGVLHSFSGSLQQAEIALKYNFLLGFGGAITFSRANKLRSILQKISLNDFILETDAPYQRGAYRQHGINYPADLLSIAESVTTIRQDSLESIIMATHHNTQQLFKLQGLQ